MLNGKTKQTTTNKTKMPAPTSQINKKGATSKTENVCILIILFQLNTTEENNSPIPSHFRQSCAESLDLQICNAVSV